MRKSELNTRPWHAESVEATYAALRTSPRGLTEQDVHRRQQEYGPNRLPEKEPAPLWLIVGRQFVSPLIYILVAAAVVSVAIGDVKDAGFIAAVLAINAVIGPSPLPSACWLCQPWNSTNGGGRSDNSQPPASHREPEDDQTHSGGTGGDELHARRN